MLDWLAAIVAGVGVALLVGLVLAVLAPLRRLNRAVAELRRGTARQVEPLRILYRGALGEPPEAVGRMTGDRVVGPRPGPGGPGPAA